MLEKGKVKFHPTPLYPSKSGDLDFNPRKDAFALRLGAEFVGPNRYKLGSLLLDANGACRDPNECPECGSLHGEYRWKVPVPEWKRAPNLPAHMHQYTYCRRCVTPEELAENERRLLAHSERVRR